jgi:microcystin degradation protein MlrC
VVVEIGAVRVLIAERPAMTVDPELFRSHDGEPWYCKIVVVKSPNGFCAAYEPIAKRIILVDTPGVSTARRRRHMPAAVKPPKASVSAARTSSAASSAVSMG